MRSLIRWLRWPHLKSIGTPPNLRKPAEGGGRTLVLNDDDSGQMEVLPASQAEWCRQQFAISRQGSVRSMAPGRGWDRIVVRSEPTHRFADLAISFTEAERLVASLFARFEQVLGGSGSIMTPVTGMIAYGPSSHAALGLIGDADRNVLTFVEIVLRESGPAAEALIAAVAAFPAPEPLILVDWVACRLVDLTKPNAIRSYALELR